MSINTTYTQVFGDSFDYPYGITSIGMELFVCDRQNDRIQVFDISGATAVFDRYIGSVGLPEGITTDGTYLYVTDMFSSTVKQYDTAGILINEFSSGVRKFPNSIAFGNNKLFIVFQDEIAVTQLDGTPISAHTGFNYPHGIAYSDGIIYLCDTYNGFVKSYDESFNQIETTDIGVVAHPYAIAVINGVVAVADAILDKIFFFDSVLNLTGSIGQPGGSLQQYSWPSGLHFTDSNFYISDGLNQRVQSFIYAIESGTVYAPVVLDNIIDLYPTGFVWRLNPESTIYKLHNAFATSLSRAYKALMDIYGAIVPDSDAFTLSDIVNAEKTYGLVPSPANTEAERRSAVLQAYSFPNGVLARQSAQFLTSQFQLAGFDVIVTKNRFAAPVDVEINFDEHNFDEYSFDELIPNENRFEVQEPAIGWTEICANHIDPEKDANIFDAGTGPNFDEFNFDEVSFEEDFLSDRNTQLRGTFFVSADPYPTVANIPLARKNEFKQLELKLKPASMVGFEYINYYA